jgi:5'-nucleotidase
MRRFSVFAALVAGLLLVLLPSATAGNGPKSGDTHVQLLAFNDFHGALESGGNVQIGWTTDSTGKQVALNVAAGGIAYMATLVKQYEAANPNTFVVSAGDNIGASPLVSAIFHDEPTIAALDQLGLFASAVGNHEFDEGSAELMRMQYGGCNGTDTCPDGAFTGAAFPYLASNVFWAGTDETIFPSYKVVKIGNAKLAFVAATLKDTPSIVTAAGTAGVDFRPEAAAINAVVNMLREDQGVRAFVVLLHQGGVQGGPFSTGFAQINGCEGFKGDIVPVLDQLDPQVDVVVSGHSHNAYNCVYDGMRVTGALSSGRLLTDIDLTIDHQTKDITAASAENVIVDQSKTTTIKPDKDMAALVQHYKVLSAPLANTVVGSITADIKRAYGSDGKTISNAESSLGDVLADAQLYAMLPQGPVAAITNPGGIRTDLLFNVTPGVTKVPGQVTYGELFAIQPFNNYMVVEDLTGRQIYAALEQQWSGGNAGGNQKMLQVSNGFSYTWDASMPAGSRVLPGSLTIGGLPVQLDAIYRMAMNNFLAGGGDNFPALAGGTNAVSGMLDIDAAVKYFQDHPSVAPGPTNRVTRLN